MDCTPFSRATGTLPRTVSARRFFATLLACALVAAACGGNDAAETTTTVVETTTTTLPATTTAAASTTTTSEAQTTTTELGIDAEKMSALNGLEIGNRTFVERRVVAVKIDNHPDARPQSGVQEADAVYELLVEGGLSRFIALFHQSDSEYVGPIRSVRPTDPTLVRYLAAPLQISGGQPWIQAIVRNAGVKTIGEGDTTFRIRQRRAPHNLYGSTKLIRQLSTTFGWPNERPTVPIATFGYEGSEPEGTATTIELSWGAGNGWPAVVWEFDEETGTYLRFNGSTPHNWRDSEGNEEQIAFDTLVVVQAEKYTARPSGAGSSVPALQTVGEGAATIFFDGNYVTGTWSRESIEEPFTLTSTSGEPLVLPQGRVWFSVFPDGFPFTWE
jgi:hypothetical protein